MGVGVAGVGEVVAMAGAWQQRVGGRHLQVERSSLRAALLFELLLALLLTPLPLLRLLLEALVCAGADHPHMHM